jgi:Tol biopolymer transport system component
LTHGYSPKLSPDGTTIAFLRDPGDPLYDGHGDPFVLQVWLMHPDGSGMRQLGQQRGCCLGAIARLNWSPDGSRIVLNALRDQTWDVATGESLPVQGG